MKKLIIIPIFLSLLGCGKEYSIQPNELPPAHVGKPYYQDINISGGRVASQSFKATVNYPQDMGVSIQPITPNEADAYNILKVEGVPKYKGKYTINISTGFYGGGNAEINKTYDFVVTD